MLLRNRMYRPYRIIAAFDDLTEATLEGVPAAIADYLDGPAGRLLRRHPDLRRSGQGLAAAVRGRVRLLPDGSSLRDLVVHAATLSRSGDAFPLPVVRSGSAIAIGVPHEALDGRGAIEFYRFVIDRAAGQQGRLDPRPTVRLPYLRMLGTHLRWDAVRAYRVEQAGAIPGPVSPAPTADDLALATARFETVVLSDDHLERAAASEQHGVSSSARFGALAIRALRRVHRGDQDLPVEIPVDLRRWAPTGRVDGNLISVAPLGSLLATPWSPEELGNRIHRAVAAKTPVVRSLHTVAWYGSRAPHRMLRRVLPVPPSGGRLGVTVSMMVHPTDYADAAWRPGAARRSGAATTGAWPSSTIISVVKMGGAVRFTVWDESGLFDLDGFEAALGDELEALADRRTVS